MFTLFKTSQSTVTSTIKLICATKFSKNNQSWALVTKFTYLIVLFSYYLREFSQILAPMNHRKTQWEILWVTTTYFKTWVLSCKPPGSCSGWHHFSKMKMLLRCCHLNNPWWLTNWFALVGFNMLVTTRILAQHKTPTQGDHWAIWSIPC